MKARQIIKKDYTVQIGYSKKAKKEKLLRFISKSGDKFEIKAEDLATMLVGGVNQETLEATFIETDKINVVEVGRQLKAVLDKDMRRGSVIRLNYAHPYPLEFAIIEQVMGIAKINMDVPVFTLTKKYTDEAKKKLKPGQEKFIEKFYKSFKNIKPNKK